MDNIENDYIKLECTPYSAAIHSIYLKEINRNITLTLESEKSHSTDPSYSGNTIFPFAGRIKGAKIRDLVLDNNDNGNSLHGGKNARKAVFKKIEQTEDKITYALVREKDDDNIKAKCAYTVTFGLKENRLLIDFEMLSDKNTLSDMTSHLYFNLDQGKTIENHEMRIDSDRVVINNSDHSAKEIIEVKGTPFDFREYKELKSAIESKDLKFSNGINNAFILSGDKTVCLKGRDVELKAKSDSPAVVIYTGGYLKNRNSYVAIEFEDIPFNDTRTFTNHFRRHIEFEFNIF